MSGVILSDICCTIWNFSPKDTKSEERGEEGQEDYSGGVGRRRSSVFEQMKNIPTAGISSESPRRPSLRRNSVSSENNQSQIDLGGSQVRTFEYIESLQILALQSSCPGAGMAFEKEPSYNFGYFLLRNMGTQVLQL